MPVPVVIDGYTLLDARGEAPSAAARAGRVRDLGRWAERRGRRRILVFDAWAQGGKVEHEETRGPVTVCFTLPPGCPKVCVSKHQLDFQYPCEDVRIRCQIFGKVKVSYH